MPYGAERQQEEDRARDSVASLHAPVLAAVAPPSASPEPADAAFATLDDVYAAARARLKPEVWEYLDGGAGQNETLADNRQAFARWRFRPRVLTGMGEPSTATTFLGVELALPLLTAPFGSDALFAPEGHRAVARANARLGIASIVPEAASFSMEEVAAAAPAAARFVQLHPAGPAGNFVSMLHRAEDAGYAAVCITADCPTAGWREHLLRSGFMPDASVIAGNYRDKEGVSPWDIFGHLVPRGEAPWSWRKLAELCARSRLPFFVKGILTAEDAVLAKESGAAGVIVSNHGGRQLDGSPASLDQLPEIREAVGAGLAVALDGGVRRATDVLKALALGADVAVLGRAAAMGLAAAGEAGVVRVLELFRDELRTSMTLAGCPDIAALGPHLLQPARPLPG